MNNLDIARVVYDDWLSGADAMLLQIVVATHGAWDLSEESEDRWFPVFSAYRDELLCSLRSVPKRWTRNDCASLHWMVLNDIRFHWFEVARILPPILDTHFYRQRLLMPWLGTQPAEMKLRFSRDNEFRYLPPIAAVTSLEIIVDVDNGRGSWPTTPWPNVRDLSILGDRHLHSNEFSLTLQTFPNLKSLCIYETRVNIVDIDDNAPIASIRMFYGSGMMLLPDAPLPYATCSHRPRISVARTLVGILPTTQLKCSATSWPSRVTSLNRT